MSSTVREYLLHEADVLKLVLERMMLNARSVADHASDNTEKVNT